MVIKALQYLLNSSKDQQPVREKFHKQLTLREKPKFSKGDDLETLRKQAEASINNNSSKKSKK